MEADGLYRALHAKDSSWDGHVRFAVLTWEFPVLAKYKFPAIAPRNGRTQREFIRELALQAGFAIDGSRVTRDQMMAASSESFTTGDSSRLAALIGLRIEQSGGLHV